MEILVFDIGGTAIKYGLIGDDFEILESKEMPTADEGKLPMPKQY